MSIAKFVDLQDITFVVLKQHILENSIDKVIKEYFPDAKIEVIEKVLPGPVYTCLEGIKNISDDIPIVFNDCDHMFKSTMLNELFAKNTYEMDGTLLTFEAHEPQFSYVNVNFSRKLH